VIGLIVKLWLFIIGLVVVVLVVLNLTGTFKPGTLSFRKPDGAPCQRIAAADPQHPHIAEVRWIWNSKSYGWGCYFEYDISDSRTITPMPK
jgi:hypothetical protein